MNLVMLEKMKSVMLVIALATPLVFGASGSFDGDGNSDLFLATTTDSGDGQLDWFEYDADSTAPFNKVWHSIISYSAQSFTQVAMGDIDGDNYMDLLVGGSDGLRWYESYEDNSVNLVQIWSDPNSNYAYSDIKFFNDSVYLTNGPFVEKLSASGNNYADLIRLRTDWDRKYNTVAPYDFDDDGKVEIVLGWESVTDPQVGHTDIFEVIDDSLANGVMLSSKPGGENHLIGNLDGDQFPDLILSTTALSGYPVTIWYESNGNDNTFVYKKEIIRRTSEKSILADIDNDGHTDLLISGKGNGEFTGWYESNADNQLTFVDNLNAYHKSNCLAVGDWDSNNLVDVIFGSKPSTYGVQIAEVIADDARNLLGQFTSSTQIVDAVFSIEPINCGDPGTVYLQGDYNKDCIVDFLDMSFFASEWLIDTTP